MHRETAIGPGSSGLLYLAAALSLGASLVHGLLVPEHLQEWWGYGVFFIVAAMAQGVYGVLLLVQPWRYDETGGIRQNVERYVRPFCLAGIAGNAAIVALYLVTRTVGIPFVGPEAGRVEPVTAVSVISKLIEGALTGCLLTYLRRTRRRAGPAAFSEAPKDVSRPFDSP